MASHSSLTSDASLRCAICGEVILPPHFVILRGVVMCIACECQQDPAAP